jgi:hypothetical protein
MTVLKLSPKSILPRIYRPLPFFRDNSGITRKAPRQGTGSNCLQAR